MTNFEYKLFHHNYTKLCMLSLLTLCASIILCSYSYATTDFKVRVSCPIDTSSLSFINDCFFYHAENNLLTPTAISQCSWAIREKNFCSQTTGAVEVIENVPSALEQINAGIENNPKLATAAKKVFFHSEYCGLNGGNFEDPKGSLNKIPCARMGQLAEASGAKYSDICDLQPESKKEACKTISDSVDGVKKCMQNMNSRVFCDELVSGFMSSEVCTADTSLCARKITNELTKDSCQVGNYSRLTCTGAKPSDLVCTGNTVPNADGTKCVEKACVVGTAIDSSGNGDSETSTIASNDCPGPRPEPGPEDDQNNDDNNNDDPNNDDKPSDTDIDNLANMADNLGNSMFGNNSGGGSGNVSGAAQLQDVDVKGDVDLGDYGNSNVQRAGEITGKSGFGTLPSIATIAPRVMGAPGGTPKKTGPGGGGNKGGYRAGGSGGGNAANPSNRGGRAAPRRGGGRGMPYADIRKNIGGHVYHGTQGTGPAAVNAAEDKKKKKKANNPGVPGTQANTDYKAALNKALHRGLSKAEARKRNMRPSNDAYCDSDENFDCARDIYLKVINQGLLNAKGR